MKILNYSLIVGMFCSLIFILFTQDATITIQRTLIQQMTRNPNCMVDR